MGTYSKRELLIRIAAFFIGTSITAVGAAVFVLTVTGTDPFGVLMQGVAKTLGITNGIAHIGINLTFLVILLIVDRKYIQIGTFVALFAIGPMIDLSTYLLKSLITEALPYPVRLLITLISCVVIGFGLAMVISANVGMGANDNLAVMLSDKLKIQFRWMRIAVDLSYVLVGYLLGGVIGVGTILCALLLGPIAQFFLPYTARPLVSLLCRYAQDDEKIV